MRKIISYVISLCLTFTYSAYAYDSADFDDYSSASTDNYYQEDIYSQAHHYRYASNQKSSHKNTKKIIKRKSSHSSNLPRTHSYGEKVIIINPRKHTWGAYSADGKLLRSGLATSGASWCADIKRACRTRSGSFRIYSLGSRSCYSKRYPVGRGGAPMPYCMFFNGHQGLHGSNQVARANLSHGCVRVSVSDAAWIRFNFAKIGTKVVVLSY